MSSREYVMVWILCMNRGYTTGEYDAVYHAVKTCFPLRDKSKMKYEPNNPDSFRILASQLLPLFMMRHGRVPRDNWKEHVTERKKHWIEIVGYQGGRHPNSVGYHLSFKNSLCGMGIAQGATEAVTNIGLGIRQLKVEPVGTSVGDYLAVSQHKLTLLEVNNILGNPDDVVLKRLSMLLALKEAYLQAIGQPMSFDFSRLECDIPNQRFSGDRLPLKGWDFRIFVAKVGVARGTKIVQEEYECVCAMFTGGPDTRFVFHDTPELLSKWVQFINLDKLLPMIPQFYY